jgi:hypothetical protein
MPPEWNTRSKVEVPELFVSGLLHESDWPTLLGSTEFSRATLSKIIWLSEGARPWPKFPENGMTWAFAAAGRRADIASAADNQCGDQGRMHLSFTCFLLPPADRPNGQGLLWGQLNFFGFVSDHETYALT